MRFDQTAALAALLSFGLSGCALAQAARRLARFASLTYHVPAVRLLAQRWDEFFHWRELGSARGASPRPETQITSDST